MGLQDRDYSREFSSYGGDWSAGRSAWGGGGSAGFGGGRSIVVTLLILNVAIFFLDMLLPRMPAAPDLPDGPFRSFFTHWFGVRGQSLVHPWEWYRFLTYGFVHDDRQIGHLAFNMLGLFVFGRPVEQRIGGGEFLRFYLVSVILGGLVAAIRWGLPPLLAGEPIPLTPTIGASGGVMALTILFAFYFPQATILLMFVIPVKAWLLAVVFVALNVLGVLGRAAGHVAYDVHLVGAAFAAAYHLRGWRLDFLQWDRVGEWTASLPRKRPSLKLHDPEKKLARQEAEVDRILEKIQASGIDSLTAGERKTLERHSRLKRNQRS